MRRAASSISEHNEWVARNSCLSYMQSTSRCCVGQHKCLTRLKCSIDFQLATRRVCSDADVAVGQNLDSINSLTFTRTVGVNCNFLSSNSQVPNIFTIALVALDVVVSTRSINFKFDCTVSTVLNI